MTVIIKNYSEILFSKISYHIETSQMICISYMEAATGILVDPGLGRGWGSGGEKFL